MSGIGREAGGKSAALRDVVWIADLRRSTKALLTVASHVTTARNLRAYQEREIEEAEHRLNGARIALADFADVVDAIQAALRPALKDEIVDALVTLDGAFTSKNSADPDTYWHLMINTVMAEVPSRIAVVAAVVKLRTMSEWAPGHSRVLTVVREEETFWRFALQRLEALSGDFIAANQHLAELKRRNAAARSARTPEQLKRLDEALRRFGIRHGS